MLRFVVAAVIALAGLQSASAECANACNGHGKCTSYDMCICNRNWQAADCSERVCQFGLAHVDTPKGDLNGDGTISNANEVVVDNSYVYPYGTTEQFPQMQNTDLQTLSDTAHYYMECSNKGKCDRTTGECQCFDGYDGVACQRASCPGYPNSCSGHGVCKTIKQLANADNHNVYELWDKDSTMGCECDAGYMGPDCSQRVCKTGVDPLYLDDAATVHYSTWNFGLFTTDVSSNAKNNFTYNIFDSSHPGYWAIKFYDSFGEDWVTDPIVAGASCAQVTEALESLPNHAIQTSSIQCTRLSFDNANELTDTTTNPVYDAQHPSTSSHPYRLYYKMAMWDAQTSALYGELSAATDTTRYYSSFNNATDNVALSGYIYLLKMYGNPGKLAEPKIDVYLDGHLPTLISQSNKVITKVWTDGQQGEDNDYFADHCAGVTVTIATGKPQAKSPLLLSYLTGFTATEKQLLKACLGSADFNTTNNVDVYNWDYGSKLYPHIVKLVRTVTSMSDGGYYAVMYYDTTGTYQDNLMDGTSFVLLNPFVPPDAFSTDNYDVYTTQGTLALTSELAQASFSFGSRYIYTVNGSYDMNRTNEGSSVYGGSFHYPYDGDISCEVGNHNAGKLNYIYHCLNKSDIFTVLNWEYPELNPPHINLYTAERVIQKPYTHAVADKYKHAMGNNTEMHEGSHMITTDLSTNWGVGFPTYYTTSNSLSNYYPNERPAYHVYKFFPAEASTYNYVNECSNRGLCDRDSGLCKCFPGYTSDNCAEQASLAV